MTVKKVLHVCLSSHFTEGLAYQENLLADIHAAMGHDVVVVSDTQQFVGGCLETAREEDTTLKSGVRLLRFRFDFILSEVLSSKVKKSAKLKGFIQLYSPDIILYHGVVGWEMLTVSRYKRQNPATKLYFDCHEDFNNSGTKFLSYLLQYRIFNYFLVMLSRSFVDKFLYVTSESKHFLRKCYGLKESEMEFFPLGGVICSDGIYNQERLQVREHHGLAPDNILFVQTGKFDSKKKLVTSLRAFTKTKCDQFRFFIIGSLPESSRQEVLEIVGNDQRIEFLGWLDEAALLRYLRACDVYVQPGSQSATMQMALCSRCAVILDDVQSHRDIFCDNGWLLNDEQKIEDVFASIGCDPSSIGQKKESSFKFSLEFLDYKKLAQRILR